MAIAPPARARSNVRAIDVGDQVAEAIDAQHVAAHDAGRRHSRHRNVEALDVADRPAERRRAAIPLASHAAAGAKRSRPSNVRLTVGRA